MMRTRSKLALALATVTTACVAVLAAQVTVAEKPSGDDSGQQGKAQRLEVFVGKSLLVQAPWAARRVAVTDPKIADVQILTPRQVLLQGKKPGITDLVMWSDKVDAWTAEVRVSVDIASLRQELR